MAISKSIQIKNVGKDMEKREHLYTVGGNVNWLNYYGEEYAGSLKTKNRTTIRFSNFTPWYMARKDKYANSKDTCTPIVHSCTIYNCQDIETT